MCIKKDFEYEKILRESFQKHIYKDSTDKGKEKQIVEEVLNSLLDKSERLSGFLRFTGVKQKLVYTLNQSKEIKTGDLIEDFFHSLFGYKYENMEININEKEGGPILKCDQLFSDENNVYLVEQKMRDDHDSTKKEGQIKNFKDKIAVLYEKELSKEEADRKNVYAKIWFIDDLFKKYKTFYEKEIEGINKKYDYKLASIFYGRTIIDDFFDKDVWDKFVASYILVKKEFVDDISNSINNYDFDNDPKNFVYDLLVKKRFKKLNLLFFSDDYKEIRNELFPHGVMIEKLKKYFEEKNHKNTKTSKAFLEQIRHGGK